MPSVRAKRKSYRNKFGGGFFLLEERMRAGGGGKKQRSKPAVKLEDHLLVDGLKTEKEASFPASVGGFQRSEGGDWKRELGKGALSDLLLRGKRNSGTNCQVPQPSGKPVGCRSL